MTTTMEKILNEILGTDSSKHLADLSDEEISRIRISLYEQLLLKLHTEAFEKASNVELSEFIENKLERNQDGKNILDVCDILKKIAIDELHPSIDFTWCKRWDQFHDVGNFLTRPDSLDFVELLMRIEEEFGINISDDAASTLQTVGSTVQYIWKGLRVKET